MNAATQFKSEIDDWIAERMASRRMLDQVERTGGGRRLSPRKPKLVRDATHPGMWRVRWPDGRLSDKTNLTRAKDAVACFMETEKRRRRHGRQSHSEGRLCVKTGELGARHR
jgi:hypothetical protein